MDSMKNITNKTVVACKIAFVRIALLIEFCGRRVAVVGNSPQLLAVKLGPSIDAHQIIVRFNLAGTQGVETNIGSRTDLRVIGANLANRKRNQFADGRLQEADLLDLSRNWSTEKNRQFFASQSIRAKYFPSSAVELAKARVLKANDIHDSISTRAMKPPRSGAVFLFLIYPLRHFMRLDVYGFALEETLAVGQYFSQNLAKEDSHYIRSLEVNHCPLPLEINYLKSLQRKGGIQFH